MSTTRAEGVGAIALICCSAPERNTCNVETSAERKSPAKVTSGRSRLYNGLDVHTYLRTRPRAYTEFESVSDSAAHVETRICDLDSGIVSGGCEPGSDVIFSGKLRRKTNAVKDRVTSGGLPRPNFVSDGGRGLNANSSMSREIDFGRILRELWPGLWLVERYTSVHRRLRNHYEVAPIYERIPRRI